MASGNQTSKESKILCCGNTIKQSIGSTFYQIGTSVYVTVTHIIDPHNFYVQPTKYKKILNHINAPQEQVLAKPELGMLCLFYCGELQKWIRGRIIYIETKNDELFSDIVATDYGFVQKSHPLKMIRGLPDCHNFPALSLYCRLDKCEPVDGKKFSQSAIDSFKFCVKEYPMRMTITNVFNNHYTVELFNGDDIATLLMYSERTVLGYVPSSINRMLCNIKIENNYYTHRKLSYGDALQVRVLSGSSIDSFYVAEMTDFADYYDYLNDLTHFCKNEKYIDDDDLNVGKPVAVLDRNKYQRAEILDGTLSNNKVKVQLVDNGAKLEVPVSRIKNIPKNFIDRSPLAMYCSAEENGSIQNINKLIWVGERFDMIIEKVGNRFETPNLVSIKLSKLTIQSDLLKN